MRNWTRCLILSNHMLPLFAHLDHNNYESIWILITCSDWYDIISLHIPSSKTSITSWFFTSIGSQPCWPRCLGKSKEIPKSNENYNLRIKRFNCFIPLIFFRALEHVQEKMLQFEVDWTIMPTFMLTFDSFLVFILRPRNARTCTRPVLQAPQ